MIYDKRIASQTLGCIFNNPDLLADTDNYLLTNDDFLERLHKIVFSAIYNLYHDGLQNMNVGDITNYISKYPDQYAFFTEKEGSSFVLTASEIAEQSNFKFYYTRLKKLSVLRHLSASGYDISPFFDLNVLEIAKRFEIEKRFDEADVTDIINHYLGNLSEIESKFINKKTFTLETAYEGLTALKERLKIAPEFGHSLNGDMFTTIVKGARKSKFYLYSGGTGVGKTRVAVGNACRLAYPFNYDTQKGKWIELGATQKILFITTELEADEIRTMILAYISGVPEDHILEGKYKDGEEARVDEAIKIVAFFKDNFIIYHMPDPNIHQLNTNVRRLVIKHKINGLFYDYIHTSPGLLMEFSGFKIREDVVLNMLSTALKNLANEMGIFVWSGTQINASADDFEFAGPHNLRGSRSIADKLDVGVLARRVTPEALKSVAHILTNSLYKPTAYEDFYKNRRSRHNQIRLWTEIDLGTCRKKDLFATNGYGELVDLELIFPKDASITVTLKDVFEFVEPEKNAKVQGQINIQELKEVKSAPIENKQTNMKSRITL